MTTGQTRGELGVEEPVLPVLSLALSEVEGVVEGSAAEGGGDAHRTNSPKVGDRASNPGAR